MSTLFDGLDFGDPGHEPHVDPATHASAHAALVNAAGVPTWAEAAAAGLGPDGGPGRPARAPTREELLDGLNPPAARGRRARGRAAAHRRRRRLGQDPGAHPPDRLPARRARASQPG